MFKVWVVWIVTQAWFDIVTESFTHRSHFHALKSGDTTPCRMTRMTLQSHVHYKEIYTRTCCGPLFSPVKPYSHRMWLTTFEIRKRVGWRSKMHLDPKTVFQIQILFKSQSGARDCSRGLRGQGSGFRVYAEPASGCGARCEPGSVYRSNSLMRRRAPLGPYSRTSPGAILWS